MPKDHFNLLMLKQASLIVLAAFFAELLFFSHAYANGAKMIYPPDQQGYFYFDKNSNISLVEENVTFDQIKPDGASTNSRVTVNYVLNNTGSESRDIKVFFVIMPSKEYNVTMNSTDITNVSVYKEVPLPGNWQPKLTCNLIEPISKEELLRLEGQNENQTIHGLEIPLTFKSKGLSNLKIQYVCNGGFYNHEKVHETVFGYLYYLTPARFWDGKPRVTLNVHLPEKKNYAFYSSIPMKMGSDNLYSVSLNDLPDNEWSFSFVDRSKLPFGTNTTALHIAITFLIAVLIFAASIIACIYLKKRYIPVIGYILSVAFIYLFLGKVIDGYIGDFLVYCAIFIVTCIVIPVIYIIYRIIVRNQKQA